MTTYCQHAPAMRIVRPGQPEQESIRGRNARTLAFEDGEAGTQIEIDDNVQGLDVDYAIAVGALHPLPCVEHPDAPKPGRASKPRQESDSSE